MVRKPGVTPSQSESRSSEKVSIDGEEGRLLGPNYKSGRREVIHWMKNFLNDGSCAGARAPTTPIGPIIGNKSSTLGPPYEVKGRLKPW